MQKQRSCTEDRAEEKRTATINECHTKPTCTYKNANASGRGSQAEEMRKDSLTDLEASETTAYCPPHNLIRRFNSLARSTDIPGGRASTRRDSSANRARSWCGLRMGGTLRPKEPPSIMCIRSTALAWRVQAGSRNPG
eukprot:8378700-Pyramimonas_sp.AAC.1